MLVLEKRKVSPQKTTNSLNINTLTPNFYYKNKNGSIMHLDNCSVKL